MKDRLMNLMLDSDSYKWSQFRQYPEKTTSIYSHIIARSDKWNKDVLWFGLQGIIQEYLLNPITKEEIDYAEEMILAHGEPFNREGWQYILDTHAGYIPIRIKSLPEGTIIPTGNVLATVENTDPNCAWVTSFFETMLLRSWYSATVATNSLMSKRIIYTALQESSDEPLAGLPFKLHDFGARGVSSRESAMIGGTAHLVNFMGSDTVAALYYARKHYSADMAAFSIPASEHSTITSWGRENEVEAYRNMIKQFGKPGAIFACVSDSYNIYEACKMWGTELKQELIDSGATLVVRPDSGLPHKVVLRCLQILEKYFGSTTNTKGYRVLNNVRVIQGDGINHESIQQIIDYVMAGGFSLDNVAFGQGGALLQAVNRDLLGFAMKCSSICVDGVHKDVYKDPVDDCGKTSHKGRVTTYREGDRFYTAREDWMTPALETIYENGEMIKTYTLDQIRERAGKEFI